MAKQSVKTRFVCSDCGAESAKWTGQCMECGAWNTLSEFSVRADREVTRFSGLATGSQVQRLDQVESADLRRLPSGSGELDRVLGGGLVPGSVVLIGGDPGIGKSTLLLQYLSVIGREHVVLYASGEESAEQIAYRAKRLDIDGRNLLLLAENRLEDVLDAAARNQPSVLVVDSIQTFYSDVLSAAPGSVSQVRECAARLVRHAKQSGSAVILVGHVTKEGSLAGPRILEHMVDSVLYFEGDSSSSFRLIRAIKNRFGAVNEIGVFAMTEQGLRDVQNPSAMFVSRHGAARPGSVVLATQEGTRPLLVEVQALVDDSALANPRRLCVGLEQNRLAMLLAIVHRHAGISLNSYDVFANVAGGVRVVETGADLALLMAILSSVKNRATGSDLVVFGEVGLSGELRPVQRGTDRLREARKLGFERALIPAANAPDRRIAKDLSGLEILPARRIDDAITLFDV
ncbi:MAG: DNA repair protein RadA [Gammaproteobacteria bacterium]|nr:DNA repair protein RadA [Gammaproteobacteria bacterium]MYG66084.1 DNA repair protein RadA [Gammaproteobacteria bacterium]